MTTNGNGFTSDHDLDSALSDVGIFNSDSAFFNSLVNSSIGIGNPKYDTSYFDEISNPRYLTDIEIHNLYTSSRIARTIVDLYPSECNFGIPTLPPEIKLTVDDISAYLRSKSIDIESVFRRASKQARKWGVSYLVLGFDDGLSLSDPLAEDLLASLEWVELLSKDQLYPLGNPSIYESTYYSIQSSTSNLLDSPLRTETLVELKIHKSRILRFLGETTDQKSQMITGRLNSALQASVAALLNKDKSIALANQLLLKKAVLYAQLKGVPSTSNVDTIREKQRENLSYVNLLLSIYRMVGLGTEETISALQIDLASVDTILKANLSELVASSGIVRQKLLGESAQEGLGQSSRGLENRLEHAQRCLNWSKEFWQDHLSRFYSLLTKTKELVGSTIVDQVSIYFPPNLELFPQEIAELRKLNSEWAIPLINSGILTSSEIRATFDPSNILEQLVPNLALNKQYTKQLEDQILVTKNEPKSSDDSQILVTKNSNSNQDDATTAKRFINWQGYKIGLQYFPFDHRFGTVLPCGYGYIQNIKSSDNRSFDCYVIPRLNLSEINTTFVIEQLDDHGEFDEYKAVIGATSIEEAINLFVSIRGTEYLGSITECLPDDLKLYDQVDWSEVDLSEWGDYWQIEDLSTINKDGEYYHYLVWFSDSNGQNKHRTPIAVGVTASSVNEARSKAIIAARKKCQRHCDVAYGVRQANSSEIATAKKGRWIRTGAKGQKQGYSGISGVGAKLGGSTNKDTEDSQSITEVSLSKDDQKVLDKALEVLANSLDSDQIDSILSKI